MDHVYTDLRAKKIHEAHLALRELTALIVSTPLGGIESLTAEIISVKQRLAEAEQMPEHTYECSTHTEDGKPGSFQSAARTLYVVTRIEEQDEDGNVIATHRFEPPAQFVECRYCTEALHPIAYLNRFENSPG